MFSLFLTFIDPDANARLARDDREHLVALIRRIPGLARAHLLSPAPARDRYFDDGPPPMLTIQLYFERLETLEEAAGAHGTLQSLARSMPPSLGQAAGFQQVMWTRPYPTPASPAPPRGHSSCSYLVHYPGPAEDMNAWNLHYLEHHPSIMRTFPDVRQIEIYTRIDWVDRLPSQRVEHMQRNKLVFDSPQALAHALGSDVIKRMRADFVQFPPFAGGNKHFPMLTRTVRPKRS